MANETHTPFARRARLSSAAICTALSLTLAALMAMAMNEHEGTSATLKASSPVSHARPAEPELPGFLPVIAR